MSLLHIVILDFIQIIFPCIYGVIVYWMTDQPAEFGRFMMFLTLLVLVSLSSPHPTNQKIVIAFCNYKTCLNINRFANLEISCLFRNNVISFMFSDHCVGISSGAESGPHGGSWNFATGQRFPGTRDVDSHLAVLRILREFRYDAEVHALAHLPVVRKVVQTNRYYCITNCITIIPRY